MSSIIITKKNNTKGCNKREETFTRIIRLEVRTLVTMVFRENIIHNALQRTIQLCSGTVKRNFIIPANSPSATIIRWSTWLAWNHGQKSSYHFTGLSSSPSAHFKTCLVTAPQHNSLPALWRLHCVAQFCSTRWPCTKVHYYKILTQHTNKSVLIKDPNRFRGPPSSGT